MTFLMTRPVQYGIITSNPLDNVNKQSHKNANTKLKNTFQHKR